MVQLSGARKLSDVFGCGAQGRNELEKLFPSRIKQKKKVSPSPARRNTRPTEACIQEAATDLAS
jgi:hypothetical protein